MCSSDLRRTAKVRLMKFRPALAAALLAAGAASAQSFPSKPIRMVSPYAAGGGSDILARALGQKLYEAWGQPVVVDNKPGGNTVIGSEALVKSPPDGYTVLLVVNTHVINPLLISKLPYDPVKDFAPVHLAGAITATYVAHPSLAANTMPELLALAKANPDTVLYGSWGVGSFPDLYRAWFEKEYGTKFRHIPYREASQVTAGVLSGEIQVIFNPSGLIAPLVKSGKLKALATLGPKRSPHLPDVPSFKELGYDLDFLGWTGMFAPTGTPRDVVMRVNGEMNKLIADPGFVAKYLTPQSMDPRGGSPEDFAAFLRVDRETNGRLAKLAGVKPE